MDSLLTAGLRFLRGSELYKICCKSMYNNVTVQKTQANRNNQLTNALGWAAIFG